MRVIYKIIQAISITELEKKVNEHLAIDFILEGGIHTDIMQDQVIYYQAMSGSIEKSNNE